MLFNTRLFFLLTWILIASFLQGLCQTTLKPFYPKESESKGVSSSWYGLVLGFYHLGKILFCPWLGPRIGQIGEKTVLTLGLTITGLTTLSFGFLTFIENQYLFISISLVLRIIEGAGKACFRTAVFTTITASRIPDSYRGMIFAAEECAMNIGIILSPILGSLLYEAGGFFLPFACYGITMLVFTGTVSVIMQMCIHDSKENNNVLVPKKKAIKTEMSSYLTLLMSFSFMSTAFPAVMSSSIYEGSFIILEPYLRSLGTSNTSIGLVFGASGLFFCVGSLLSGLIGGKFCSFYGLCILGNVIVTLGLVMFQPQEWTTLEPSMLYVLISTSLISMGDGIVFVTTFSSIQLAALELGYPDEVSTYGLVSGLYTAIYSLAEFLGAYLFGVLADWVGIANSVNVFFGLIFAYLYVQALWKLCDFTFMEEKEYLSLK